MGLQQRKETVEYAVLVSNGEQKTVVPKNSKSEADDAAQIYNNETPLFGDPVEAIVIARTKTIITEYSKWGKVKPRS